MERGTVIVLAPWRHYGTGREIEGWHAHDQTCGYPVVRVELLRPAMQPPPGNKLVSVWRVLSTDIPLKLRVAARSLFIVRHRDIKVVCIGELVSGAWIGEFLRMFSGVKVALYIHGEEITTKYLKGRFGSRRARTLQRADAIVAVSRFTREALIRDYGITSDKIYLIPNGVDIERFSPGPDDGVLRQRYGLGSGPVVLCVGRLVARKGFDQTIRAMFIVQRELPDAKLLIIGEGEQDEELRAIAKKLNLTDVVRFAGPVSHEDLLRAYRTCSVFVMPNRTMPDGDTEGFGLVFLEANACGRAVIGGRAGGAVDAVIDGETGLLVEGKDENGIAAAILSVLTNTALRTGMEQRARQHAEANDWQARVKTFHRMCHEVVSRGASTGP